MEWFKNYKFTKISEQLGPVKWLLPNQGKQHNVVPSECDLSLISALMIAIPTPEILEVVKEHVDAEVCACTWMHLLSLKRIRLGWIALGRTTYGSPPFGSVCFEL
jgi:acetylornithine deacetylase